MPHQCVRCSAIYDDGAKEILSGCPCGAKLFFFISKKKLGEQFSTEKFTDDERKQIEEDVFDLIGSDLDREGAVVLDLESIKIKGPGKYELDLVHLFKGDPVIYKLEEGKYMIDIIESFKKLGKE